MKYARRHKHRNEDASADEDNRRRGADTSRRFPEDQKLRAPESGFEIYARPNKGPAIWIHVASGVLWTHADAVAKVKYGIGDPVVDVRAEPDSELA